MSKPKRKRSPLVHLRPQEKLLYTTEEELALNRAGQLSDAQLQVFSKVSGCMLLPIIIVEAIGFMFLFLLGLSIFSLAINAQAYNETIPEYLGWFAGLTMTGLFALLIYLLVTRSLRWIARRINRHSLREVHSVTGVLWKAPYFRKYWMGLPEYRIFQRVSPAVAATVEHGAVYTFYMARKRLIAFERGGPSEKPKRDITHLTDEWAREVPDHDAAKTKDTQRA